MYEYKNLFGMMNEEHIMMSCYRRYRHIQIVAKMVQMDSGILKHKERNPHFLMKNLNFRTFSVKIVIILDNIISLHDYIKSFFKLNFFIETDPDFTNALLLMENLLKSPFTFIFVFNY